MKRRLAFPVAAAGLLLIGLAQGIPNRHSIEESLTQRSVAALEAAGLAGVQVSFAGRDGALLVLRKSDVDKAKSIVANVEGVRVVTAAARPLPSILVTVAGDRITADGPIPDEVLAIAKALGNPPHATVELRDGRITLAGRVSPRAHDAALEAAGQVAGPSNVVDELQPLPPPVPPMPPEVMQRELTAIPPITFENDSATLTAAGRTAVEEAADLLRRNLRVKVRIEGHTDGNGSAARNLTLSQARAQAVLDALVSLGIAADRLSAIGFGETRPKVPDTSADNRAINRRVEFVVEAG